MTYTYLQRNLLMIGLSTLLGAGCQPITSEKRADSTQTMKYLIGSTGRKYWDEIYATDIDGNYQQSLTRAGHPVRCLAFDSTHRLMHYYYQDTVRIFDAGCNNDVQTNPDRFSIKGDTIRWLADQTYKISFLSEDLLVVRHLPSTTPNALVIYQKSPIQKKLIMKCEP